MRPALLLRGTVALVFALLIAQGLGYATLANRRLPAQLSWYLPPPGCSSVAVQEETWRSLSQVQADHLEQLLRGRFPVVVHDSGDIPESEIIETEYGPRLGTGRCYFWWAVRDRGPFWLRAAQGYYAGPTNASGALGTYVWVLYRWVAVGTASRWYA